jgi:hypothetical protein
MTRTFYKHVGKVVKVLINERNIPIYVFSAKTKLDSKATSFLLGYENITLKEFEDIAKCLDMSITELMLHILRKPLSILQEYKDTVISQEDVIRQLYGEIHILRYSVSHFREYTKCSNTSLSRYFRLEHEMPLHIFWMICENIKVPVYEVCKRAAMRLR